MVIVEGIFTGRVRAGHQWLPMTTNWLDKNFETCPEWLLWKVSSQGGLEPATDTQRKQPIPPTASGGQQHVRDENNHDIDDIVLKYSKQKTKKYLLHEGVGWGDHLSSLLFQSTRSTIATSHKKQTHSVSCEIVVNAIGGFANPDDDDFERSRGILVSPWLIGVPNLTSQVRVSLTGRRYQIGKPDQTMKKEIEPSPSWVG